MNKRGHDGMHDYFQEFFYQRLGKLRSQKGVSAMGMSTAIGQEGSYIGKVENKGFLPSMSVFFHICDYFGISPKEFFDMESQLPETLGQLLEDMKGFDEEEMDCIKSVVSIIKKKK